MKNELENNIEFSFKHSYGFYLYGKEFLDCFKNNKRLSNTMPLKYYLIGHALELFLKSFLISKDYTLEYLRKKLNHDLYKTINECIKNNFSTLFKVNDELIEVINNFNNYYYKKNFEYFCINNNSLHFKRLHIDKIFKFINDLEPKLKSITYRCSKNK